MLTYQQYREVNPCICIITINPIIRGIGPHDLVMGDEVEVVAWNRYVYIRTREGLVYTVTPQDLECISCGIEYRGVKEPPNGVDRDL